MNNITIELSQEDRDRLDRLTATLQELGTQLGKELGAVSRNLSRTNIVMNKLAPEEESLPETPASEELPELPVDEPTPFDEAPAEPEAPKPMELAEFQKQIVAMCVAHPEKKVEIQGIVKQYGSRVSAVPEDKRSEVMQKLEALTNG